MKSPFLCGCMCACADCRFYQAWYSLIFIVTVYNVAPWVPLDYAQPKWCNLGKCSKSKVETTSNGKFLECCKVKLPPPEWGRWCEYSRNPGMFGLLSPVIDAECRLDNLVSCVSKCWAFFCPSLAYAHKHTNTYTHALKYNCWSSFEYFHIGSFTYMCITMCPKIEFKI